MINRRYLRIKVFQALYAYWQSPDERSAKVEKEMLNSIERTTDLYLALLLAFGELRHAAQLKMDERKKKRLPTPEDLSPNMRFVEHPFLKALAESERLQTECSKRRVSWVGHAELFQGMLRDVEQDPAFKAFMNDPEPTWKKDQAFFIKLFSDHVANHEALQDVFEGRSIHWLEDLDLAATMVKRVLEQMRQEDAQAFRWEDLDRDTMEDLAFARELYRRSIDWGAEHEEAISKRASNWESDRIAVSDMILMKMALAEARAFDQVPVKVSLNEYIEIAKAYSTPKSKNFINGVLDKLFMEMKEDGRIRKVGRGLLES